MFLISVRDADASSYVLLSYTENNNHYSVPRKDKTTVCLIVNLGRNGMTRKRRTIVYAVVPTKTGDCIANHCEGYFIEQRRTVV